ncbi:Protein of unknown function [Gryllus bimaculatus]|nr:Protein of unknown function [Gryllus bimaculatus]
MEPSLGEDVNTLASETSKWVIWRWNSAYPDLQTESPKALGGTLLSVSLFSLTSCDEKLASKSAKPAFPKSAQPASSPEGAGAVVGSELQAHGLTASTATEFVASKAASNLAICSLVLPNGGSKAPAVVLTEGTEGPDQQPGGEDCSTQ